MGVDRKEADFRTRWRRTAASPTCANFWFELPFARMAAAPAVNATSDPAKLAALRESLASNRPRPARQRFAELRPGLSLHCGPETVQVMARSLAALDFPAALRARDAALADTAAELRIRMVAGGEVRAILRAPQGREGVPRPEPHRRPRVRPRLRAAPEQAHDA